MSEAVRYIMSEGELKRKDNSLCFRKNGKNNYIPIEGLKEIYCLNEVSINTKLLDFLASNGVVVHFFNYHGSYSGTFFPRSKYISGRLTVKQAEKYMNNRNTIAKAIVRGIIENTGEVLHIYYKHGKKGVEENMDYIKEQSIEYLGKANNIKEILAVEGQVWIRFYDSLKYILNEEFEFDKRVKRPPDNPINAMISFGNTILYTKVITQIYHTHLNQAISFLHEPSEGRFSLSLDLAEVFKPVIVYKTIFKLANKRIIRIGEHFDRSLNYCILNDEGKKIFISNINSKFEDTFKHKILNRKVSYNTAIKLDAYKLIKNILENKEFKPFSLKEMV